MRMARVGLNPRVSSSRSESGRGGEAGARRIVLRVRPLHVRGHHPEIRERRLVRRAMPKPGKRLHHARVAVGADAVRRAERARRHRHIDVVLVGKLRDRRQHANDGVRPIVHLEDLADDARVGAEAALPVGIREHQDGIGAVLIVAFAERPPGHGRHAEEVEVVPGDDASSQPFRLALAEQHEPHVVILDDRLERLRLLTVVLELERREPLRSNPGQRALLPQDEQVVALGVRQRPQQDAVHDAENRRIGANTERHRQDDGGGKAAIPGQSPRRRPQILHQRIHIPNSPPLSTFYKSDCSIASALVDCQHEHTSPLDIRQVALPQWCAWLVRNKTSSRARSTC